ncbi:MAG: NAD(P)H-binding protein [Gammaproteobacteria bacterium]|nr:NAD(P)H-binding protein [Gammaproteobacteria bacterium]
MKVAVIGGTGFVGSHIVDALTRKGHHVSLLVRPGSEDKVSASGDLRTIKGDLGAPDAIAAAVEGCDAVIYCVGILREDRARGITYEALQYRGVVDTVAAARAAGVQRFLLMSANGVRRPGTPYQETKLRAEEVALGSDLDVTIFRPSVIFGDPNGRMEIATQLYRDMVKPPIPAVGFYNGLWPGNGQILMSPVHVEDVADAFVGSLDDARTAGEIYTLGGPDDLSWSELIRRVAETVQRRKWIIPCPIGMMKFVAGLFAWSSFFPVTPDQLTMLAEGNTVNTGHLEKLLGKTPRRFTVRNLAYLKRELDLPASPSVASKLGN